MSLIDRKLWKNFDWPLFALILVLMVCSLVFIANTQAEPFTGEEATLLDYFARIDFNLVLLQLMFFGVGLAAMIVILFMDYHSLRDLSKLIYIVNLLLLALLFFIAKASRGVQGWYSFGDRRFQPSELCKITLIIMSAKLAAEAHDRDGGIKTFRDLFHILAYALPPLVLVMLQPDWGTAFVYVVAVVSILFAAKLSWKKWLVLLGVGLAALPLMYFFVMEDWQKNRIDVFLGLAQDLENERYHTYQSEIAIGSGGLTGKGIFVPGAMAQLNLVPEDHTDFIFATIVEAIGFIGGCVIMLLYFLLLLRCLYLAAKAKDSFGSFLIIGVVGMMAFHIFENISMTMSLLPVTGIPLPLMSYGGSSLLTNMIAFGIVLNVAMRRPQKRHMRMTNTAIDLE